MNIEQLRHFLLWCTIINYAILLLWVLLTLSGNGWLRRLCVRLYRVSGEQFDAINLAGMSFYKLIIIVFNLVPLIVLYVAG
jgi:hypothetical protein